MYTEYQITAALIKVLNGALGDMNISGFRVMMRNPPNMVTDDQVVLVDRLDSRNIGFQGTEYLMPGSVKSEDAGKVKVKEEWLEEIVYQITALKKRKVGTNGDNINTFTQDDCINGLRSWLNSTKAAISMRKRNDVPMAPVYVSSKRVITYQDNNEVSQRSSQIDLRIHVVQNFSTVDNAIQNFKGEVFSTV